MAKRTPRLQGRPNWVIASLAGAIAWAVASSIAIVFFEVAVTTALVTGLVMFAIVAAPTFLFEAVAIGMAISLEFALGVIALVVLAPLALLGSCG